MLIISRKPGRLANMLWILAHTMALSIDTGQRIYAPAFSSYADDFEGTNNSLICEYPPTGRPRIVPRPIRVFMSHVVSLVTRIIYRYPSVRRIVPSKIATFNVRRHKLVHGLGDELTCLCRSHFVLTDGWRINHADGVERHRDLICRYLTPAKRHRDTINSVVEQARDGADLLIGIHVRQGDLRHVPHKSYLFLESSEYALTMATVSSEFPDKKISFLVCSDDEQNISDYPGMRVTMGPGSDVGDLYALAACDRIIATPSTFAIWASYWGHVPLFTIREKATKFSKDKCEVSFPSYYWNESTWSDADKKEFGRSLSTPF